RLPRRGRAYRGDELFRRAILEQITTCPGFYRAQDVTIGVVVREYQDGRRIVQRADQTGRIGAGLPGAELEVHQDDVGSPLRSHRDRFAGLGRLADDVETRIAREHGADAGADDRVVVRQQ